MAFPCSGFSATIHSAICRDVIELAIMYTRGRKARGNEQLRHSRGCFWNVSDGTNVSKLSSWGIPPRMRTSGACGYRSECRRSRLRRYKLEDDSRTFQADITFFPVPHVRRTSQQTGGMRLSGDQCPSLHPPTRRLVILPVRYRVFR